MGKERKRQDDLDAARATFRKLGDEWLAEHASGGIQNPAEFMSRHWPSGLKQQRGITQCEACRSQTTNLRVGRSNRSGRTNVSLIFNYLVIIGRGGMVRLCRG